MIRFIDEIKSLSQNDARLRFVLLILAGAGIVLLVYVLSIYLPPGVDWEKAYYPAAGQLLSGKNPFDIYGFYNAPWALLPILPLAFFPINVGRAAFLLLSLAGFGFAAYKLGAKPISLGAFMASPPVMHCLLNASLDWMPLVGFVLPPRIGLFLVVIKPQVGSTVALFWLIEAWRRGGWREAVRTFWPVTLALLLSFAVFGLWPLRAERLVDLWWNASLWPASIPVGLGLFAASVRKREKRFAMASAPCLSPYVLLHSWSGALASIVQLPFETIAVVVGLWILILMRALG